MRVLFLTNMYPYPGEPFFGVFIRDQCQSVRREGIEVDVLFINGRARKRAYLETPFRVANALKEKRYDIIHAHHSYVAIPLLPLRRLLRPTPPRIVLSVHEGELLAPRGYRDRRLLKRLIYWSALKKAAVRIADHVVFVNRDLAALLGKYAAAWSVIPPGVDLEVFRPRDRKDCRQALGLPLDKPVVFFPSDRRRPEKNFVAVEAAVRLLGYPVKLVIGGGIPPTQMPVYLSAADCVVVASHFEASPMVVKEAMACNVPIVSTNVGDVAELVAGLPGYQVVQSSDPQVLAAAIGRSLNGSYPKLGRQRLIELGMGSDQVATKLVQIYRKTAR